MKIYSLVDNCKINHSFKRKHGVSLYIETGNNKILFDIGPDNTIEYNTKLLNIDLKHIDYTIISHGHIDHGGFLDIFQKKYTSNIYIQKSTLDQYYYKFGCLKFNISIPNTINLQNIIMIDKDLYFINDNIILFTTVNNNNQNKLNRRLYHHNKKDDFSHEQYLLIKENNSVYLFSACSHNEAKNILEKAKIIVNQYWKNSYLSYIFMGLHLYDPIIRQKESKKYINHLNEYLKKQKATIYTFHCTGIKNMSLLNDNIHYFKVGDQFINNQ